MSHDLITEDEFAKMMGVTIFAVRKWRNKGLIAFIKVGKTIRFESAEVDAFIERHRKEAAVA